MSIMQYDDTNIFAQIIAGTLPCDMVYDDNEIMAFRDIAPAAPVHILVIPKMAYISFHDFTMHAAPALVARFFSTVAQLANTHDIDASGYRIISNHGANASQTVPHFHVHLLGGRPLGGLLVDDSLNR